MLHFSIFCQEVGALNIHPTASVKRWISMIELRAAFCQTDTMKFR